MRSLSVYLLPLILILACPSCTKSGGHQRATNTDTASIIGTWTWAYQTKKAWFDTSGSAALIPSTTGINRTLVFDTAGRFTIIHNDSIFRDSVNFEPDYLMLTEPVLLLPGSAPETDTAFYQVGFGIVGCAFTDTTTLTIQNVPYQVILTADTLLVHGDPCLSRVVDIYIRQH
ncbi:MAG TPA: hypothetical protein VMH27_17635 [Puia sp.]|nr:hypothetical protein [Puia sp.]